MGNLFCRLVVVDVSQETSATTCWIICSGQWIRGSQSEVRTDTSRLRRLQSVLERKGFELNCSAPLVS